jgi:hypothetical protein
MEVVAVAEDKFWLHEGGPVPPRADGYGPPPIPLDELRQDLPPGRTAERAWRYSTDDEGHVGLMPITIVRSPDGDYLQFFPRTPRHLADDSAGSSGPGQAGTGTAGRQ